MKKLISFAFLFFLFITSMQSESIDLSSNNESATQENSDEIDSLFNDATDVAAVETPTAATSETTVQNGFSFPLRVNGKFTTSAGAGVTYNVEDSLRPTAYFSLENDLNFSVRPVNTFGVSGSIVTTFPSFGISVDSLYFDYLLFKHFYFTAGKYSASWGYIRMFNDTDYYSDVYALASDIMWNSGNGMLAMVRVPVWTGTITTAIMYDGGATSVQGSKISFAGSIEMVVFNTSINLFCRKFSKTSGYTPAAGIDLKRTILGADVYVQGLIRGTQSETDDSFDLNLTGIDNIVITGGMYDWWEDKDPHYGFNIEMQEVYFYSSDSHLLRLAFDGGISRLGRNHNIKIGIILRQVCMDSSNTYTSSVNPGISISGILPFADWKSGLVIEYGGSLAVPHFTVASGLTLTLNY
jgi:hypothetical protein